VQAKHLLMVLFGQLQFISGAAKGLDGLLAGHRVHFEEDSP